jgi:transposase
MSIFVDPESCRVLHAVGGKGEKDIASFLKVLRKKTRKLEAVAMDMSAAFTSVVEVHLPLVPTVFDGYHVFAFTNKSIEELRRDQ